MFHVASPTPRRKVQLPRLPFWSIHFQRNPLTILVLTSYNFHSAPKVPRVWLHSCLCRLLQSVCCSCYASRQVSSDCSSWPCLPLDLPIHDYFSLTMARSLRSRSSQTFITAHHPVSKGLVERTNRKIIEILRHHSGRLHETWENWLSQVTACINSSVKSSTGNTSHYIVFGFDKKLSYDVLSQPPLPCITPRKLQLHSFQITHASVREPLKAWREDMVRKQHLHTTPVNFDVRDSVMLRSPVRSCKLDGSLCYHINFMAITLKF